MLIKPAALLSLLLAMSPLARARDVRIGVLGIFHPRQVVLDTAPGDVLIVKAAGETFALEPGHGTGGARLRVSAIGILVEVGGRARHAFVAMMKTESAGFGGRLQRHHSKGLCSLGVVFDPHRPYHALTDFLSDLTTSVHKRATFSAASRCSDPRT